ncbi:MAG: tetratricopeptide repeat protein [Ktedonobacterales bacterium]
MQDVNEWRRKMALRLHFRQQQEPVDFPGFVEELLQGKVSEVVIPDGWEEHMNGLIRAARRAGERQRESELRALRALFEFIAHIASKQPPELFEGIREILAQCEWSRPAPIRSFILGSLGIAVKSRGMENEAKILTQKAIEAARAAALRSAELQWAANLAVFETSGQPRDTARELRRLLAEARRTGDERLVGMMLNNLAVIHAQFLSDVGEAIRYQQEALSIASRIGDRRTEISRSYYLAQIQEQAGMVEPALRSYDHGLALEFKEAGLSSIGMQMVLRVAKLVTEQYQDLTRATLATHVKVHQEGLNKKDIQAMLEQARSGPITAGWDPENDRTVSVTPDPAFASQLASRKEWGALAVYAYHWIDMDSSGALGKSMSIQAGYHWLAVALRSLGWPGAADAALSVSLLKS